ncbi:MAG: SDR family NAD(P)-dependent oxidoreductase [Patescibacteria group bacterium]
MEVDKFIDLTDKVAIVTGGAMGIGLGITERLARSGAKVLIADMNEEAAAESAQKLNSQGYVTKSIKTDVSSKADVDKMIEAAISEFGKLDILVNNAGIYPMKPFFELTEEDWDKVMAVNLKGTFLCTQAAAEKMVNGGKIVDISSIAGFVGFSGLAHYCATKGGINASIRAIAVELAPKKINVNAVAPGAIETPGAKSDDTTKQQTISAIPLARMGQPEDIANLAVFLSSGKADYITGQTIIVDGGWTLR